VEDGNLEIDNNLIENVIQSFGLRFLCGDANNAEKKKTPKLCWTMSLGIIVASFQWRLAVFPGLR
jgi:hypothetical protein